MDFHLIVPLQEHFALWLQVYFSFRVSETELEAELLGFKLHLSDSVREADTLSTFRTKLKTFLFHKSYS